MQDLSGHGPETDLVAPSSATLGARVSAAGDFVAYTVLATRAPRRSSSPIAPPAPRSRASRSRRRPTRSTCRRTAPSRSPSAGGPGSRSAGCTRATRPGARWWRARAASAWSLAGDRVAYARATSAGAAEIVVQALDGPFVPASFPIATPTGFDFDGTRVAFASSECVYTALADGVPAGDATPAGPCPRAKALVRPGGRRSP